MDNLKNKSPQLSNMPNENPFRVPEHYFDDFSARLQNRIDAERITVPNRPNRFIRILKPALGLAASFALIALLVYGPVKVFSPNRSAENQSNESSLSDIEYMNTLIKDMDEYSFYALFNESSSSSNMNDDEIANYLQANISEYDMLYAETQY